MIPSSAISGKAILAALAASTTWRYHMNKPTLGDYLANMEPVLDALVPSDGAITIGFNEMNPVTDQVGSDPIVAFVRWDSRGEQLVEFAIHQPR